MRPQTSQTPKPLFKQIVQNLPIPSSSQKVTDLPWHPLNQPSGHPQSERPRHLPSQHFYIFRHLLVQPDTHSPNWTVIHKLLVILLPTSDTHPSTQTHTHPSRHTIMHTQTHTCIFEVNESDPRSDVHYLGSSENKAWKQFRPVRDLNSWPLRYRCSALPTGLTSQLGAGHDGGSK